MNRSFDSTGPASVSRRGSLSFAVLGLSLTLVGCDGSVEPMPPGADAGSDAGLNESIDAGVIDAGAPVEPTGAEAYANTCAACHGATGEGSAIAYQLRSPVRAYATFVVRRGRHEQRTFPTAMAAYSEAALPNARLERIYDFLDAVTRPVDGQGLYLRFCGNCHGFEAEGGRVGEALVHKAWDEPEEFEEAVREGHHRTDYGDRKEFMPSWTAEQLSGAEVELIVGWLTTRPDPGDDDDDGD